MSEPANTSRERILQRISAALKTSTTPPSFASRPIFPAIDDLLERFSRECANNHTECIASESPEQTRTTLCQVITSLEEGHVFAEDAPELRAALNHFSRRIYWSSDSAAPETAVATITTAEALIAETGSLLVSSRSGGRRGSIVAPVHVVIAKRTKLLPTITTALEFAMRSGLVEKSSFVGLVTGCSRTADIEKLLVIGAHGPKRLVVIVENG